MCSTGTPCNVVWVQHACKHELCRAGGLSLVFPPHLKAWAWPLELPFTLQMVSRSRLPEDKEYSLILLHQRLTWLLCDLEALAFNYSCLLLHFSQQQYSNFGQLFIALCGCVLLQQAFCLAAVSCSPVHADL